MTSVRIWGPGVGAVVVLVATGAWAHGSSGSSGVDSGLWAEVRPVIEDRLADRAEGSGYGESEPGLDAKWFCHAEALDLEETGDRVRAGVDTLCLEYGVRDGALVECSGEQVPRVVRLARDTDGGYRVVAQEEPPDGAGYGEWEKDHFSYFAESRLGGEVTSAGLDTAARAHFGLPADAPVGDC